MPDDPRSDAAGPRGPDWSPPGYECSRLLGRGASGEVWQARRVLDGEEVALKRVRAGADDDAPARLRREAALLAVVEHEHLLPLRGVLPQPDGVVLVLPVAGGGSVAGLLRRRGRLRPGQVVTLAAPVASALAEVHSRGLVHADVAPGNVLLDADGRPLLADLGVARGWRAWPTGRPRAPPASWRRRWSPARSRHRRRDVWSLGALARAVLRGDLTGERPVDGDGDGAGQDGVPPALADALAGALDPGAVAAALRRRPRRHAAAQAARPSRWRRSRSRAPRVGRGRRSTRRPTTRATRARGTCPPRTRARGTGRRRVAGARAPPVSPPRRRPVVPRPPAPGPPGRPRWTRRWSRDRRTASPPP